MRTFAYLIIWFFIICGVSRLFAQGTPSEGNDYYIGFINPSINRVIFAGAAPLFNTYTLVSSLEDNVISLSYFDPQTGQEGAESRYTIPARQSKQIKLDANKMRMTDPGDKLPEYRSCHIKSEKPISVQFFSTGTAAGGSYLAFPINTWGKHYVVQSWNDNPSGDGAIFGGGSNPTIVDTAAGVFMVIAGEDGTTITITPTSTTQGGNHTGKNFGLGANGTLHPYSVSMNRGQCYMVKSWASSSEQDISATTIISDKPIFVLAGHENASLGNTNGKEIEGRDFMIESMIPCEYWESSGYIDAPMIDSSPIEAGNDAAGQTYRIYTCDTSIITVTMSIQDKGSTDFNIGPLAPPVSIAGVENAVHFYSKTGKKFGVMAYDQRCVAKDAPYPAPSMMSIVPKSRWRNSYLWSIPGESQYHDGFINIILPIGQIDNIKVSQNGWSFVSLKSVAAIKKTYSFIPDHQGYQVLTCRLPPGHYYATAGMLLLAKPGKTISVKVDTLCDRWRVCITDNRDKGGIKSALLLNDPLGAIVKPSDSMVSKGIAGYTYNNVSIDTADDKTGSGQIVYSGNDENVCFTVHVNNTTKNAYAPILIRNNIGDPELIELRFRRSEILFIPDDSIGVKFSGVPYKSTKDSIVKFINLKTNQRSYYISNIYFKNNEPEFAINDITPPLPTFIRPGDTLSIAFHFTARDTNNHIDSIILSGDCISAEIPIQGKGTVALIYAGDVNFGTVTLGKQVCKDLFIENRGTIPFTLKKEHFIESEPTFILTPSSEAMLPVVIPPKGKISVSVCYKPTVIGPIASFIVWTTDIAEPYTHSIKDTSFLKGNASEETGVDSPLAAPNDITIIPNPVGGRSIEIGFGTKITHRLTIELYDLLGRHIHTLYALPNNKNSFAYDVSDLANGSYILRIGEETKPVQSVRFEIMR